MVGCRTVTTTPYVILPMLQPICLGLGNPDTNYVFILSSIFYINYKGTTSFLDALSSPRNLVIGLSVGWSVLMRPLQKKGPLEYCMLTITFLEHTYLPTYLTM